MCVGVVRGFASLKFSGSVVNVGFVDTIVIIIIVVMMIGVMSFVEKNGWKDSFSWLFFLPVGLEDPVSWREARCIMVMARITIGVRKCRLKNRVSVGCLTENPPHIHSTMVFPKYGMAEKMFVMTVAPQNDICPHGKTYPRNAVAISKIRIIIPDSHVFVLVEGEEKNKPRVMCVYARIKNSLAPVVCSVRKMCPEFVFRVIIMVASNAVDISVLYCIEIMIPVVICSIRVVASMDPIFHKYEMLVGVGRSISDLFMIFSEISSFRSCFCIGWILYWVLWSFYYF